MNSSIYVNASIFVSVYCLNNQMFVCKNIFFPEKEKDSRREREGKRAIAVEQDDQKIGRVCKGELK